MARTQVINRVTTGLPWMMGITLNVAFVTLVLSWMHASASVAGIVYLVFVVWFATLAGPALAIYIAVVSSLCFDFYFLEPLHSFALGGFQSWLSMLAFLSACVIVSRVADRARHQTRHAEQRREDVERLYALSQEMMLHEDAAGLVREIPRLVEQNFALDVVMLYVRDEDHLYSSVPGSFTRDSVHLHTPEEMKIILQTASSNYESSSDLPKGYSSTNLVFGMNSVGTLAWKPSTLSREVSISIAAQVAIAITRAHAIEASTRLEAARAADRLRTALIDSLTHELRTPLTAIRAAASTLASSDHQEHSLDAATRSELAAIVDEESSRLDSLIGEAMEIAQIESDGIRVRPEPLHTGTFLEQAVEESHDQLVSHRVTIIVQQPDDPVWFDPHLIGRVLRHLLENAARYTPVNSRILLHSRRSPGRLEFCVEDDGPGIDAYDLPLIFDKFYRGKRGISTAKGSGMGLAITRALLAAHGGSIEAQSAPGQGSKFRLWVPIQEKAVAPLAPEAVDIAQ